MTSSYTYIVPHEYAIHELHGADDHEEEHKGIDELSALGRLVDVRVP